MQAGAFVFGFYRGPTAVQPAATLPRDTLYSLIEAEKARLLQLQPAPAVVEQGPEVRRVCQSWGRVGSVCKREWS
jgi:hypothetical protein